MPLETLLSLRVTWSVVFVTWLRIALLTARGGAKQINHCPSSGCFSDFYANGSLQRSVRDFPASVDAFTRRYPMTNYGDRIATWEAEFHNVISFPLISIAEKHFSTFRLIYFFSVVSLSVLLCIFNTNLKWYNIEEFLKL